MKFILNADDFGYDDDTVEATIECFERRALSSATIMPGMPAAAQAVSYALRRTDLGFGVHLTFAGDVGERPLTDPAKIPTLVRRDGTFHPGGVMLRLGTLSRLSSAHIETEMRAQIEALLGKGIRLSHIDSHGHIHKSRQFVSVLRKVLPDYGLSRVRRGQNVWLDGEGGFVARLLRRVHPRIDRIFDTTDEFFMPTGPQDAIRMNSVVERLRGRVVEVGVHPGYAESWRDIERSNVQALAGRLVESGHAICTWHDVTCRANVGGARG